MTSSCDISRLLDIMAALRNPDTGCPWDIEQTFATIAPYTIEESYEVADAIARGDLDDLKDELGDLLLQVVFHARMAEEQGAFAFGDVVDAIVTKMIRRHPHVFGDKAGRMSAEDVAGSWVRIKNEEKAARAARNPTDAESSLLSSVKAGQPALARALELQRKASTVGFDWNDPRAVLNKIREEADEIEAALDRKDQTEIADETGDLLFAVVNLARHAGADPEPALRSTNAKFERRFGYIERTLGARGVMLGNSTLEEMDALWNEAKRIEAKYF
ncbi:MAG: nucleoside triphosphate pyrophosphohydrolase, partial [Xanthobacteraceae bacterium]|nr:nucleoside triphosphate pyrophosphohydrolase [Xanthobacteraceae bacterium]